MESWRIELKPGEPRQFRLQNLNNQRLILHVKATLGEGVSKEKSVIKYSVGEKKSPEDLCEFLPDEYESYSLTRELGCDDNSVEFSVVTGDRCIILSGYLKIDNTYSTSNHHESHDFRERLRDRRLPSREELFRQWSNLSIEDNKEKP
ncbi:hypothetical protein N665_0001s0114 [Sinapis alba]|nr:hypothetical protein N665_0001s0114 [Sinapis alba]